jgi:hypothetical protein
MSDSVKVEPALSCDICGELFSSPKDAQDHRVKVHPKSEYEKHDKITEATLKPVTKVKSKLDRELQEWEVESTKDGQDSQGNG